MIYKISKIAQAKANLLSSKPFYAIIALRLQYVEFTEEQMKNPMYRTMATDGQRIYYNPEWVESLHRNEVMGVLAHEILHIALLHTLRLKDREPIIWNIATDASINNTLKAERFQLPEGGIDMPQYVGWYAERIYRDLIQNHTITVEGCNWGVLMPPQNGDGTPLSEAEKTQMEAEVKVMITQAIEAQKSIGNLPGCVAEIVDQYSKPKVDWRTYIPTWLTGSQPDDYSWRHPSRKWITRNLYMPGVEKRGCGKGVLGVDSSGSVTTPELQRYLSEMIGLIEDCHPEGLTIVVCDTKIQNIIEWEPGTDLSKIECSGRGGTHCTPIFKWIEENASDASWILYFTDLEIPDFPKYPPDQSVLWVSTGQRTAPFGSVINVEI